MKSSSPRSFVVLLFVALTLLSVGCTGRQHRPQLEAARGVVTGLEVATKVTCDREGPLGSVRPISFDAPEPTLDGVVQAVRSYVCNDVFGSLLAEAREYLRRELAREDTATSSPGTSSSAASDGGAAAATPTPEPDHPPDTPDDAGPPPVAATDAGEVHE